MSPPPFNLHGPAPGGGVRVPVSIAAAPPSAPSSAARPALAPLPPLPATSPPVSPALGIAPDNAAQQPRPEPQPQTQAQGGEHGPWPEEENYGRKPHSSGLAVPVTPPAPEPGLPGWSAGRKARIAIVIDDMGLNMRESRRAVALPEAVTLSYIPYAPRLREQTREARDAGHELMLHLPMEPMGRDNPGPGALLTGLPEEELRQRLALALSSFVGFDGVNNHMGSKFTASEQGMEIVVDELRRRQLFFLDSRTSAQTVGEKVARREGLPAIGRDVFLDDSMTYEAVKSQIAQLERVARRKGYAVAIGHPHAATLQALEEWIPEAKRNGFEFVAVRSLVLQLAETAREESAGISPAALTGTATVP